MTDKAVPTAWQWLERAEKHNSILPTAGSPMAAAVAEEMEEYAEKKVAAFARSISPPTPEPAQPAESPEARARVARGHCLSCPCLEGGNDSCNCGFDAAARMLAATTARPTERGAVEAMREACAQAVEGLKRKTPYEYNAAPCWGTIKRGAAAIRALTPPVTVAATDQAGEVEARALLLQAGVHENEDTAIGLVPYSVAFRAVRAALATQPATWQQPELPMDVRRLVVAARRALDANDWASTGRRDRMRTLDKAVEAFSSRVDYDDQPATGRTDQVADAGKPIATGRTMGGEVEAADIAEIHEIVTAWRSSIGNPATWLPRLRATLQNRGE